MGKAATNFTPIKGTFQNKCADRCCQFQATCAAGWVCFVFDEQQGKRSGRGGSQEAQAQEEEKEKGLAKQPKEHVCQAARMSRYDGWTVPHHSPGLLLTAHNGSEINREAEHFHQLPL